jgi:hypothetical protein
MTSTADFRKAAFSFHLGSRLQSNAKPRDGQPKMLLEVRLNRADCASQISIAAACWQSRSTNPVSKQKAERLNSCDAQPGKTHRKPFSQSALRQAAERG